MAVGDRVRRLIKTMRTQSAEYTELHERRELLRRPWEEEFLHWSLGPHGWELHGHVPPPSGRRLYGVTRNGWCVAQRR